MPARIADSQALLPRAPVVLRHTARVGDFREAALGAGPLPEQARAVDGLGSEEQVHHALKLACWLNTVEVTKFSGGAPCRHFWAFGCGGGRAGHAGFMAAGLYSWGSWARWHVKLVCLLVLAMD